MAYSMGHAIASVCVCLHMQIWYATGVYITVRYGQALLHTVWVTGNSPFLWLRAFSYMAANTGGVPVQVTSTMFSYSFGQ